MTSVNELINVIISAEMSKPVPGGPTLSDKSAADRERRSSAVVYVIDSDLQSAEYQRLLIEAMGFKIFSFSNPDQIDANDAAAPAPDVIVMGMVFSQGATEGLDALTGLRSQFGSKLPVIFVSDKTDAATQVRAFRDGGNAYLPKPVDSNRLCWLLDELSGAEKTSGYNLVLVNSDQQVSAKIQSLLRDLGHRVQLLDQPAKQSQGEPLQADCLVCSRDLLERDSAQFATRLREWPEFMKLPILIVDNEANGSATGVDEADAASIKAEIDSALNRLLRRSSNLLEGTEPRPTSIQYVVLRKAQA